MTPGSSWSPHRDAPGDLWLSTKGNGLFRSTNGGWSFAKVASCEALYTLGFGAAANGASYLSVYQVATVRGVTGVYRSDDAATTWRRINDDQHQRGWIGQAITGTPAFPAWCTWPPTAGASSSGSPPDTPV